MSCAGHCIIVTLKPTPNRPRGGSCQPSTLVNSTTVDRPYQVEFLPPLVLERLTGWWPLASHLQRPQGFELIIMTWQRRGLIKATRVNAHRLKALAVELSEIKLLPLDHQKAQADERGINHTALPAGETIDAAQGEKTLRQRHLQLSVYSRGRTGCNTPSVSSRLRSSCGNIEAC